MDTENNKTSYKMEEERMLFEGLEDLQQENVKDVSLVFSSMKERYGL